MNYRALNPSRYLQAAVDFAVPLTLTISKVELQELPDLTPNAPEGATKRKGVVWFSDTTLGWIMNVTNAFCLAQMFGADTTTWAGKRVTLHQEQVQSFGKMVPGIRLTGSPDLPADLSVVVKLLKKKPVPMVLKKTGTAPRPTPGQTAKAWPHWEAFLVLCASNSVDPKRGWAWLKSVRGRAGTGSVTAEDVEAYRLLLSSEPGPDVAEVTP